jgi:hypothetical protein
MFQTKEKTKWLHNIYCKSVIMSFIGIGPATWTSLLLKTPTDRAKLILRCFQVYFGTLLEPNKFLK